MRLPPLLDRLFRRLVQAWRTRGVTLKAASFAVVGVVNTFIDLGIFLATYNLLNLPLIPANVLAWLVAVSGSYVMNSFITFAAESGRQLRWRAYGAAAYVLPRRLFRWFVTRPVPEWTLELVRKLTARRKSTASR